MKKIYESTRDCNVNVTASEAVLNGISPDGGLYVMRDLDIINIDVNELVGKNYHEIAYKILKEMLNDFSDKEIGYCVSKAYNNKFSSKNITPIVKVGDKYILELFHGKTSAFKDVALSILPYLITTSFGINKIKEEVVILTATSGDTGKAALEGFKNVKGTKIIVFYPDEGVSQVQKAQMLTQEGNNTFVSAIEGNFDDAQTGVKNIFTDNNMKKILADNQKRFSSANSINIGRLIPQIVYYFYSYIQLLETGEIQKDEKVNFVVPTGNFGNILAGYYAKLLGLPINKLICASNKNNVLYDFIKTGVYDANREFYKTISPSMDILVSSNLERLLYYMSDNNNEMVKDLMMNLVQKGKYEVENSIKQKIEEIFFAGYAKESEITKTIREVYEKDNYLIDTHTAVACKVLEDYKDETGDKTKNIVLSTASPFKFAGSVYKAIFGKYDKNEFNLMYELSEKTGFGIPDNLMGIEKKPILHESLCKTSEMKDTIIKLLNI